MFSEGEGHLCEKEAEWLIVWDGDESSSAESCSGHLQSVLSSSANYVVYPIKPATETHEELTDSESDVSTEGPALHRLSTVEKFTCPRRLEMTDGYTEPNSDFWEHRNFEHFQRCSYCGFVRPEDAVGLLRTGWILIDTDKPYKHMLVPVAGDGQYYSGQTYKVYKQHFANNADLYRAFLAAGSK